MKRLLFAFILSISCAAWAQTQTGDVLGAHDLSAAGATVRGGVSSACLYCHAPHSGTGLGPLWAQTLSSQVYTLYSSDTIQNKTEQPPLGASSSLCLSCHDGTVAPGMTVPYGQIMMSGKMTSLLGTQMETSHPFSLQLPIKDSADLVATLASSGTTADPTKEVKLVKGNVECTSCHNPHAQRTDKLSPNFLVRDNIRGGLCLSCHETQPRTVNSRENVLAHWTTGVHSNSSAQVSPSSGLGGYSSVAEFACLSCHVPHNAAGASGLLRNPVPPVVNVDNTSQSCMTCHDGSDKLLQPIANVFGEFTKKGGHPFPSANNLHSAAEAVVLNQNRHAGCADCHDGHAASQTTTFTDAPGVRPSQRGAKGVAYDGSALTTAVTNQFENCLRCHGNSAGKQLLPVYGYSPNRGVFSGDPLNLIQQFSTTAASSHPVMRDAIKSKTQPSLLSSMWDISGKTQARPMGARIFCTDCHNSDNNREFGGTGPNGPHGSNNDHILERRYEASQVAPGVWPNGGPGTLVLNLNPAPPVDPGSGGPYSLCAKCHNLSNVLSDASFANHSTHIQKGISCSVCHTSHGVPSAGVMAAVTVGDRLVNFDVNVVAPYQGEISFKNRTCVMTCHMMEHDRNGKVTPATAAVGATTANPPTTP